MKITDILSESPVDYIKAGAKLAGKVLPKAKDAVKVAPEIEKELPTASNWVKQGAQKLSGKSGIAARDAELVATHSAVAEKVAEQMGSEIMNLFYALDIAKEVINYNYEAGKLDKNAPDYQEQLRNLRGKFIVAVLGPKVVLWAGNKLLITKIFKVLPWIVKKCGGVEAAAILRQIGSKGAEAAMLAWWSTDSGKKWLQETFGTLITGVGTLPEIATDVFQYGKAAVQVATGTTPKDFEPATKGANDVMGKGAFNDPFKGTSRAGGI